MTAADLLELLLLGFAAAFGAPVAVGLSIGAGALLALVAILALTPIDALRAWREHRRTACRHAEIVPMLRQDSPNLLRLQIDLDTGSLLPCRPDHLPAHQRLAIADLSARILPPGRRHRL